VTLQPRYEGVNVGTWVGFKHVNYLVEEAALAWFRSSGWSVSDLYHDHGLCLDVVGIDTRIVQALRLDDTVHTEIRRVADEPGALVLKVALRIAADGPRMVSATVRVALRFDPRGAAVAAAPTPLAGFVTERLGDPAAAAPVPIGTADPAEVLAARHATDGPRHNGIVWRSTIPYYHCHFSERLQMSGYLRLMEEAKHRFVAARGVSIKTLLDEQGWIPAVPHSRITLLGEAAMEEELYTVLTVTRVFKRLTYTSRFDTYVRRDGALVPTATGEITHGYAQLTGRSEWNLVSFDDRLLAALHASGARP
jgi:acyl-CoA thioesterase FadM